LELAAGKILKGQKEWACGISKAFETFGFPASMAQDSGKKP
jgi:hypothetical protein